ncbi:MAG: hypothetical protein MI922_09860, partial [Bacteroidales bacterium]|nr:hypothetical protein [Bacteroidales bacterium]
ILDEQNLKDELNTNLSSVMNKFNTILNNHPNYNSNDVSIDIIFFDPTHIATLKLKSKYIHSANSTLIKKWNEINSSNARVLIYFIKTGKDQYVFNKFTVTEPLSESQLPTYVTNYINKYIIEPVKGDYKKIVYKTVNAIKNAFDQQYKHNLITAPNDLIPVKTYYKGYSQIGYSFYNFKNEPLSTPKQGGCHYIYYKEPPTNYNGPVISEVGSSNPTQKVYELYVSSFSELNERAYYYDLKKPSKYFLYKKDNSIQMLTPDKFNNIEYSLANSSVLGTSDISNLSYHFRYFDFKKSSYTGINDNNIPDKLKLKLDEMLINRKCFKEWPYDHHQNSPLTYYDNNFVCEDKYKVVIYNGIVKYGDEINEWEGVSRYGNNTFRYAQPTWCNVFARMVGNKTFGQDILPKYNCKKLYNKEFTVKPEKWVEITNDPDIIWDLVNNGFFIHFISKTHIETVYPDGNAHTKYRYRHNGDLRYSSGTGFDSNVIHEDASKKTKLVVGAGTSVGFKEPYDSYRWLSKSSTKVYLYLEYLKNE